MVVGDAEDDNSWVTDDQDAGDANHWTIGHKLWTSAGSQSTFFKVISDAFKVLLVSVLLQQLTQEFSVSSGRSLHHDV